MNFLADPQASLLPECVDLARFYQAIFRSQLAVYVLRIEPNGLAVFEDANEIVGAIANCPLSQIRGQRPLDCLPDEIGECLEEKVKACVESGDSINYERSLDLPTGRVAFNTSLTPIVGSSGEVAHVVGITRDITHEADLFDDAQHKTTLLQRLGIALPSAVYLLNIRTQANRFIGGDVDERRQRWRAGAEAAGSEAVSRYFHPDDHAKAKAHLKRLATLRDGEVVTIEYRILTEGGDYRLHSNTETVFSRTADGEVEVVLGVSEDISQRDRAEKEVQSLSDRLLTMQVDERRRIAEELHDSTGQHLIAVSLSLARARASAPGPEKADGDFGAILEALDDAKLSLGNAQREIRVLSYLLHPPEIVSQGLGDALTNLARGFARRAGLEVEVRVSPGAASIDDEVSLNLFRVCQEALTNIYRHAGASRADITLEVDRATIRLEVRDDGVGMGAPPTLGAGLSGMRERMKRLGGEVQLSGGPGGAVLVATIPVAGP